MSFPTAFARDQWYEKITAVTSGKYLPKETLEQETMNTGTNMNRRNAQTIIQIKKDYDESKDKIIFQGSFEKAARSSDVENHTNNMTMANHDDEDDEDEKGQSMEVVGNTIRGWRKRYFVLKSVYLTYYTKPPPTTGGELGGHMTKQQQAAAAAAGVEKKGTIRVLNGRVKKLDILGSGDGESKSERRGRKNNGTYQLEREIRQRFPQKLYCLELEEGRDLSLISKDLLDEARRCVRLAKILEIERLLKHGIAIQSTILLTKMLMFAKELQIMLDFQLMNQARSVLHDLQVCHVTRQVYLAANRQFPKTHIVLSLLEKARDVYHLHPMLPSIVKLDNFLYHILGTTSSNGTGSGSDGQITNGQLSPQAQAVRTELVRLRLAVLSTIHSPLGCSTSGSSGDSDGSAAFISALKMLFKLDIASAVSHGLIQSDDVRVFVTLITQFIALRVTRLERAGALTKSMLSKILKIALSLLVSTTTAASSSGGDGPSGGSGGLDGSSGGSSSGGVIETEVMDLCRLAITYLLKFAGISTATTMKGLVTATTTNAVQGLLGSSSSPTRNLLSTGFGITGASTSTSTDMVPVTDMVRFIQDLRTISSSSIPSLFLQPTRFSSLAQYPLLRVITASTSGNGTSALGKSMSSFFGTNGGGNNSSNISVITGSNSHTNGSTSGYGNSVNAIERELLSFSKELLTKSLLIIPDSLLMLMSNTTANTATGNTTTATTVTGIQTQQDFNILAIETFVVLQCIMGDRPMTSLNKSFFKKSKVFPTFYASQRITANKADCIQALIELSYLPQYNPINIPTVSLLIRDELYIQLCKQLTINNTNTNTNNSNTNGTPTLSSLLQGWLLFSLYLLSFAPSNELSPFLQHFAEDSRIHYLSLANRIRLQNQTSKSKQQRSNNKTSRHSMRKSDLDEAKDHEIETLLYYYDRIICLSEYIRNLLYQLDEDKQYKDIQFFPIYQRLKEEKKRNNGILDSSNSSNVSYWNVLINTIFDDNNGRGSDIDITILYMTGECCELTLPYGSLSSPHRLMIKTLQQSILPVELVKYLIYRKRYVGQIEDRGGEIELFNEYETMMPLGANHATTSGTTATGATTIGGDGMKSISFDPKENHDRILEEDENIDELVENYITDLMKDFAFYTIDITALVPANKVKSKKKVIDMRKICVQASPSLMISWNMNLQWYVLDHYVQEQVRKEKRKSQGKTGHIKGRNGVSRGPSNKRTGKSIDSQHNDEDDDIDEEEDERSKSETSSRNSSSFFTSSGARSSFFSTISNEHESGKGGGNSASYSPSSKRIFLLRRQHFQIYDNFLSDDFTLFHQEFAPRDMVARRDAWKHWLTLGSTHECIQSRYNNHNNHQLRDSQYTLPHSDGINGTPVPPGDTTGTPGGGTTDTANTSGKISLLSSNEIDILPDDSILLDLIYAEDSLFVNSKLALMNNEHYYYLIALQLALSWYEIKDDDLEDYNDYDNEHDSDDYYDNDDDDGLSTLHEDDDEDDDDSDDYDDNESKHERSLQRRHKQLRRRKQRQHHDNRSRISGLFKNRNPYLCSSHRFAYNSTHSDVSDDYDEYDDTHVTRNKRRRPYWKEIMEYLEERRRRLIPTVPTAAELIANLSNPAANIKKKTTAPGENSDDEDDGSSTSTALQRREEREQQRYRRYNRRKYDNDEDDSNRGDNDDDDDSSEYVSIASSEPFDENLEMNAWKPSLVRINQVMTEEDKDFMFFLLTKMGLITQTNQDGVAIFDDDVMERLFSMIAEFHRILIEQYGGNSTVPPNNPTGDGQGTNGQTSQVLPQLQDFNDKSNEIEIDCEERYRYYLKRCFHKFLISVCPYYGHYFLPVKLVAIELLNDGLSLPTTTTGSNSANNSIPSYERVMAMIEREYGSRGMSILVSVSPYGLYFLHPKDWSIIFSCPYWDVNNFDMDSMSYSTFSKDGKSLSLS